MQNCEPKIFEFSRVHEYLAASLAFRKSKNQSYSLRSWSKALGFKNPSHLSEVVRGKRSVSPVLATKLADNLRMSDTERQYLTALAHFSNSKTLQDKKFYFEMLQTLHPEGSFSCMDLDQFSLIADWYHLAILEMVDLKGFKERPALMAKQLGSQLSAETVRTAIERLVRLGLLERDSKQILKKSSKASALIINQQIKNAAIEVHHRQTIEKALVALQNQSIEERDFSGTTIALTQENVLKFKDLIYKFHREVHQLSSKPGEADSIYRLNLQFFKLAEES